MKVCIMRHGEAEHYANSDAERELTIRGRDESLAVARACERQGFSQFESVLISPYLRAQQTWETISEVFKVKTSGLDTYDEITPYGTSSDVFHYVTALAETNGLESILLVSHLPLVGYLTAEFVSGITPPMFPTSGLVCIDYDVKTRQGELLWHIHP